MTDQQLETLHTPEVERQIAETLAELPKPNPNAGLIDSMRQLADWLEQHPEVDCQYSSVTAINFPDNKEGLADCARRYGPVTKNYTDYYFNLCKKFGTHAEVQFSLARNKVCKQVITKKTVTRQKFVPTDETETIEVQEKSWDCSEPLLS